MTQSTHQDPPRLEDYGLDPERYRALKAAFDGANTLIGMLVFLVLAGGFVGALYASVSGAWMTLGLVVLALVTAFLLMLFLSGVLKILLSIAFTRFMPGYVDVRRYEHACRRHGETT